MRVKIYVFFAHHYPYAKWREALTEFYTSHTYYVAVIALLKVGLGSDTYLSLVVSELNDTDKTLRASKVFSSVAL